MNRELFDFIKYDIPDDNAGGGGDLILEGVFETENLQEEEVFFLEGDPNIPIIKEQKEEDTPEMKALKDQNELLTKQMNSLQTQADSTLALTKGLEGLGQSLRQPQVQQSVQQVVDPTVAKKAFDDKFYDAPSDGLEEFAKAKIEPALQQMLSNNLGVYKQLLLLDPERGETYKKYTEDVDKVFDNFPPQKKFQDPNAYKEATDIVASKHLPETMSDMKEQIRKEIMAELKGEGAETETTTEPALHSETGKTRKLKAPGRAFVLPREVWEYAGRMGYQGRGEKEDKAMVYNWWKDGKLKESGIEYK